MYNDCTVCARVGPSFRVFVVAGLIIIISTRGGGEEHHCHPLHVHRPAASVETCFGLGFRTLHNEMFTTQDPDAHETQRLVVRERKRRVGRV